MLHFHSFHNQQQITFVDAGAAATSVASTDPGMGAVKPPVLASRLVSG